MVRPPPASSQSLANWYAHAFYDWQRELVDPLRQLLVQNAPQRRLLTEALGERAVNAAFAKQAESLNAARQQGILSIGRNSGLTVAAIAPVTTLRCLRM